MKYLIRLTALALLAIFVFNFTSCQKNNLDVTQPISTEDSIYVDKIYVEELNASTSNYDSIDRVQFAYDNNKRVVGIKSFEVPSTTPYEEYAFSYGSDTLPVKLVYSFNYLSSSYTATTFFFYNAQGRKIKDSTISTEKPAIDYTTITYSYGNNQITSVTNESKNNIPETVRLDTATLDARGNVSYSKYYGISNGMKHLTYEANLQYDNNLNSLSLLSSNEAFGPIPDYYDGSQLNRICHNNLTIYADATFGSPITASRLYTYSYYANGLPKVVIEKVSSQGESRVTYTYKKL